MRIKTSVSVHFLLIHEQPGSGPDTFSQCVTASVFPEPFASNNLCLCWATLGNSPQRHSKEKRIFLVCVPNFYSLDNLISLSANKTSHIHQRCWL